MRFMILVKATPDTEREIFPPREQLRELMADMAAYHEELARAGVLLDGAGLRATSRGFRVAIAADGTRTVTDGPFTETKELLAGYTLIQVRSRAEALEWARRYPSPRGRGLPDEIEVRQLYEEEDFPRFDDAPQDPQNPSRPPHA